MSNDNIHKRAHIQELSRIWAEKHADFIRDRNSRHSEPEDVEASRRASAKARRAAIDAGADEDDLDKWLETEIEARGGEA